MSHAQIRCPQCQGVNRVRPDKLGQAVCGRCKNKLTPSAPLDLDDAGFDALVRHAAVPVLLDLWSPTCGPCRMVAPDVARLAEEQAGKLLVAKIDVSRHPMVAQRLGVRGVPTFVVYRDGQVERQQAGAMRLQHLTDFVEPYTR